jgi:hypothetical protein
MPVRVESRREETRSALARTIIRFVIAVVSATLLLAACGPLLGVPPDTMKIFARVAIGVIALAAIVVRFYFPPRSKR